MKQIIMKQIIMKSLIILISSILLIFVVGCGDDTEDEAGGDAPTTQAECDKDDTKEWKPGEGDAEGECVDKVAKAYTITSTVDAEITVTSGELSSALSKDNCVKLTADQIKALKVTFSKADNTQATICDNTDKTDAGSDNIGNDCNAQSSNVVGSVGGRFALASTAVNDSAECKDLGATAEATAPAS